MGHDITDFQKEVIERSRTIPVVVDFWAEWCGPCKALGPILERVVERYKSRCVLVKLDTDKQQDIATQYGIRGIPAVKLFVNGEVIDEFTGALPEPMVVKWLEKALPGVHRNEVQRGEELIREGNVEEARKVLGAVVADDPADLQARVLLAETYVAADIVKAGKLVEGIEEDSEHFPMADAIRTTASFTRKHETAGSLPDDPVKGMYIEGIRRFVERDYDGALGKFIEVIRMNRSYDDDGARKACIAIFRMLGAEHEVTLSHRRDFSSALNA